jgi:hypothetical protein
VTNWRAQLTADPLPALLGSGDEALFFFTRRDLLGEDVGPVESLWHLPQAAKIVRKQQADGAWKYPPRKKGLPNENYNLLETYRMLRVLIEQYGFDRRHPAIGRAADYVFAHQSAEGDIRGMFGTEYAPHYTAWLMELLIKAGYGNETPIERGFAWFLAKRQDDGGWAWPIRTAGVDYYEAQKTPEPIQPDRSKPFSHVLTGGILRAFAVHPDYRQRAEAHAAADLLQSRFFKADKYPDRKAPHYWTRFQYPFWWPNLLTALDSLSLMGYSPDDTAVRQGLDWFIANRQDDGLWPTSYKVTHDVKDLHARLWITLAVCRVFKRWYG